MREIKVIYFGEAEGDDVHFRNIYFICPEHCEMGVSCADKARERGYKLKPGNGQHMYELGFNKNDEKTGLKKLIVKEMERQTNVAGEGYPVKCPALLKVLNPIGFEEVDQSDFKDDLNREVESLFDGEYVIIRGIFEIK